MMSDDKSCIAQCVILSTQPSQKRNLLLPTELFSMFNEIKLMLSLIKSSPKFEVVHIKNYSILKNAFLSIDKHL